MFFNISLFFYVLDIRMNKQRDVWWNVIIVTIEWTSETDIGHQKYYNDQNILAILNFEWVEETQL